MKYSLIRFNNIGKYFKSPKAYDGNIKELREEAKAKQVLQKEKYKDGLGMSGGWGITYQGINKYGDLVFQLNSQSNAGKYTQHIRFYDFMERKPKSRDEILSMMRDSDVGLSCNDPSFLYWGAAYNATKNGYNIYVESRAPKEPNKQIKDNFVLCKHLIALLHSVPFYWNNIIKDYKKYFNIVEGKTDLEEKDINEVKEGVGEQVIQTTTKPKEEEMFTKEEIKEAEDWVDPKVLKDMKSKEDRMYDNKKKHKKIL